MSVQNEMAINQIFIGLFQRGESGIFASEHQMDWILIWESPPKSRLYLPSILAGLQPFCTAEAKSFQMLRHFLFPMAVIFQSFFIIIIFPERALSLVLKPGSQLQHLAARLFSFLLPPFGLKTPGKCVCVSDMFVLLTSLYSFSSMCSLPTYCNSLWCLIVFKVIWV